MVDAALARFWVADERFYDAASDVAGTDGALIDGPRDLQGNAAPSGNAMMAIALLKLSDLAMAPRYADVRL